MNEKEIPLRGFKSHVAFRLAYSSIDPAETIERIKLPGAYDLVAASVLARIGIALETAGSVFSGAHSGRGRYASATCNMSAIVVSMFLFTQKELATTKPGANVLFEMNVTASKLLEMPWRLRLLSRRPRTVEPSTDDRNAWTNCRAVIEEQLRVWQATDILWE